MIGGALAEQRGEARACAVQPDLERAPGAAQRLGGLSRVQAVPGDQGQQFPIGVGEAVQRGGDDVVAPGLRSCRFLVEVEGDPVGQRLLPSTAAPDVGAHVAGDPEQPRQVGRHLVEARQATTKVSATTSSTSSGRTCRRAYRSTLGA